MAPIKGSPFRLLPLKVGESKVYRIHLLSNCKHIISGLESVMQLIYKICYFTEQKNRWKWIVTTSATTLSNKMNRVRIRRLQVKYCLKLQGPHDFGDCLAVNLPISASMLVDLGSGLGHLPRRVLHRLGATSPRTLVVAVESDARLHETALQMEAKEPHPERRLVRLFAHVEKDEVCLLKEKWVALNLGYSGRYHNFMGLEVTLIGMRITWG